MTEEFSYDHATFPYHPDGYTWPRLSVVTEDMTAAILNVHCLRDMNRKQFSLVGFIGANREDQISQVIFLAKQAGAEVIVFRGVGFTDEIIGVLMARMEEPLPNAPARWSPSYMSTGPSRSNGASCGSWQK